MIGFFMMFRRSAIKHKFGAKRCYIDNKSFRSKLERSAYLILKEYQRQGYIIFFLRETPFELSDDTKKKHKIDFLVFFASGKVGCLESKGMDLEAGKLRRELTEGQYGIKIHVAKRDSEVHCFVKEHIQH